MSTTTEAPTTCAEYAALCDAIDAAQAAKDWDESGRLCEIRRKVDHLHAGHPEAQISA